MLNIEYLLMLCVDINIVVQFKANNYIATWWLRMFQSIEYITQYVLLYIHTYFWNLGKWSLWATEQYLYMN